MPTYVSDLKCEKCGCDCDTRPLIRLNVGKLPGRYKCTECAKGDPRISDQVQEVIDLHNAINSEIPLT